MTKDKNKANRIVENYKKEVENSIHKYTKQNTEMIAYLKKFDKALLDEKLHNEYALENNKKIVRQVIKLKSITKKELEIIGARMDKAALITITLFALNNELAKQKSFEKRNVKKITKLENAINALNEAKKTTIKTIVSYAKLFGINEKILLLNLHKLIVAKNNAMSASTKEAYKKTSLENYDVWGDIGQGVSDGASAVGSGMQVLVVLLHLLQQRLSLILLDCW